MLKSIFLSLGQALSNEDLLQPSGGGDGKIAPKYHRTRMNLITPLLVKDESPNISAFKHIHTGCAMLTDIFDLTSADVIKPGGLLKSLFQ